VLRRTHYLGNLIGQGKIEPEEGKVTAVRDYPTPVTKRDVRAFLGLVGYDWRFVPHFVEMSAPLANLTKRKEPYKVRWNQECETSFKNLKDALLQKPVLGWLIPQNHSCFRLMPLTMAWEQC